MDIKVLYKQLIGDKLEPLIIKYDMYKDIYQTYPYKHIEDDNFEQDFVNVLFDSIIFYAYEKNEIESEYKKGHFKDLRRLARVTYNNRVPKTEKKCDGLLGELTLDAFIKLFFPDIETVYARAKYVEKLAHKEANPEFKGSEIKGYDGLAFSVENGKKYFWAGQAKTGDWDYCLNAIKDDINKSIIKYYFADSICILTDIMTAFEWCSEDLKTIINQINEIIYENIENRENKTNEIIKYFKEKDITIRIPCLLMPLEVEYQNKDLLLCKIKDKIKNSFKNFREKNKDELPIEIMLLVFPIRNLDKVRDLFLEVRKKKL